MATTTSSKVSLKLLIDRKKKKVLFAEGGKDFVDFLFNLLALPIGTVIKLLTKQNMVGSLGNLYDSVQNLNETYMQSTQNITSVLNPKVENYCSTNFPLLLNVNDRVPEIPKIYECLKCKSNNNSFAFTGSPFGGSTFGASQPYDCHFVAPNKIAPESSTLNSVGYVKGVVTYMVMDDLVVKPMSTISSITMLNKFNIKEVGDLEEKEVDLTITEGVKLLKASLQSNMVLTDVFLGNSSA